MHSSYALVSGINKAFRYGCPHLINFLEARLVSSHHLKNNSTLNSAGIKDVKHFGENDDGGYGTMVADPWQDTAQVNTELFDQ